MKNLPAIEGGRPVRDEFLLFGRPQIHEDDIAEVVETLRSGWWGTGPRTREFEKKFADFVGAKHALALNSCTAGMHLALDVLGVSSGDEVITTPMTFVSTANVIVHCGAKPVLVDVDKEIGNINAAKIEKAITERTKVILPVHLHGRPCDMSAILAIARKHNLFVLEDAAHAIETWYHGQKVGTIGDITAFSFYATKNIATGEGGMVTTNNIAWAEEMRIKSLHGISQDAWKRYSQAGFQSYEAAYPGYKYNMMDIQAALGLHQLTRLEENWQIRNQYWQMYNEAFATLPELILPAPDEASTRHARHLYAILIRPDKLRINRGQFIDALKTENIGTGVHFTALHLHRWYRETFGFKLGDFPNAEFISERTVSLPLSPALSKKDICNVIEAVEKIVSYYRK
ncbi:MAG: DegT/DnrJ/EryC1/StrS family aminotransferase [Candidatus Cloacimonetes bacterium]|nr:DegT/DnrJ/EryC1/StrS family aminotransferase [Candidatus Cloacimonadota bacterium]